jgi:hypothetical protein
VTVDISELLGLPYPEGDDPQAVALYMQDLAYKLEDLLNQINLATLDFNDRPCAYWQNAADSMSGPNAGMSPLWDLAAPLAYNGSQSQVGALQQFPRLPEAREGLWLVGCSWPTLIPTGVVNTGTYRRLTVAASGFNGQFTVLPFMGPRVPANNASLSLPLISDLGYESNTSTPGTPLTAMGLCWVPPGAIADPSTGAIGTISTSLANGNTSTGFTLAAGSGFLWAVWMGYGTQQIVTV